eukprot:scaffold100531_cov56-Attheya_sp.AAC.3
MVRLVRSLGLMLAVDLFCAVSAFSLAPFSIVRQPHLFSAKGACMFATKISDWDGQVSEPPKVDGRRYGPNWSIDEALQPKKVDQKAGAFVWAIGNEAYVHPELRPDLPVGKWLNSRPNLGICMSGGGLRAATCALGWYRALNHLKILQKARFLGANSGSTWTTLPLSASNVDINYDEYLGKYVEPDQLKHVDLTDVQQLGKIGTVLEKSNILKYNDDLDTKPSFNDWCDAIDKNFVAPIVSWKGDNWKDDFWLDLSNAYLWNTEGAKDILNNRHTLPFPIFVSTCYAAKNPEEFFPVENTLFYSGIPVDPRLLTKKNDFGGGFVQGVALNSKRAEDSSPVPIDNTNQYIKDFELPSPVVKISELTGASSDVAAAANAELKGPLGKILDGLLKLISPSIAGYVDPGKYKFWSPSSGGDVVDLEFVDGGMYDNLGVLALLRRGCSTVIVCNAADGNLTALTEDEWPSKYSDVAALFGKFKPPDPCLYKDGYKNTVNPRSHVFAGEEFKILMKNMTNLQKEGRPLVVRKKYQLISNKFAGIYEAREVDMIFCFNGEVDSFEEQLSAKKVTGLKPEFPYIATFDCNFTVAQVNKLSLLNSYNLAEGLKNVSFDINDIKYDVGLLTSERVLDTIP